MTAGFAFVTVWRVKAPLAQVWEAVYHTERWPQWWPGAVSVGQLAPGGPDGVGNVRRYIWKGALPYRLAFTIRATRIERFSLIEGVAAGDVSGVGVWRFGQEDGRCLVRYEWNVALTRAWMRALALLAGPLLRWNHDLVMRQGAAGLGRLLGCETAGLTTQGARS